MQSQIVLAVCFALVALTGCSNTLGRRLKQYGYAELQPPSRLVPPGTMIRVIGHRPMTVGIVCPQDRAFGHGITNGLVSSAGPTSVVARKLESEFKLTAKYAEQIDAKLGYKAIRDIKLVLSNVRLWEMPDTAVYENVTNRARVCVEAIRARQAEGAKVSVVTSVIEADVTYTVFFERNVEAEIKSKITQELAAELGGNWTSVGTNTIGGQNLFWGLRDDSKLVSVRPNLLPPTGGTTRLPIVPSGTTIGRILAE